MAPFVSVLVPTYNRRATILREGGTADTVAVLRSGT
jgi:hypothetical protein